VEALARGDPLVAGGSAADHARALLLLGLVGLEHRKSVAVDPEEALLSEEDLRRVPAVAAAMAARPGVVERTASFPPDVRAVLAGD